MRHSMKDSQDRRVILFHLKRFWAGIIGSNYIEDLDIYEEIKAGRKTSEWRDNTPYWRRRLISFLLIKKPAMDYRFGIVRVWFVCGYPKDNLPRLEATITEVLDVEDSDQLEVRFRDVVEVNI